MQKQRMIENEKDLFCQNNHSQPVLMIDLDPSLKLNQKLLCQECIAFMKQKSNSIGFQKAIEMIEKNRQEFQEFLENMINIEIINVESLKNQIINLKSQLVLQLDQLLRNIKDWIDNLQSIVLQYSKYSLFKELDSIILNQYSNKNDKLDLSNQITSLNNARSNKSKFWLTSFTTFPQYQNCIEILNRIEESQKLIQQQFQLSPKQLEFINDSKEQKEKCRAIAFDPTGKIMVSTSDNEIKIWNFDHGQITLTDTLQGHQGAVYSLIYSKFKNCFFSGSRDNSIRLWKQLDGINKWQSSKPCYEHQDFIYCMIITEKEDQLVSGSTDTSIKVWRVDYNNNELQFLYSLEKHTTPIVSLSLNQSGNVLVSCGYDGTIIIWQKKQGRHVKFLKENQFIWVAYKSNYVCVFEYTNGVYQENKEKRVQFKKDNKGLINWAFFPIIYNKDKNLICLRHVFHICILKVQDDGKLIIIQELDIQNQGCYGAITSNGQYLTYWGGKNSKYETYEILYQ
ncbi:unnamed protein product [Paramecium primaurelia]|uniref:Uncharacterized protein n=1 Tax=Paramecium primaurelia TaxID=5886 RepID=A0A8S1N591_PARPR|nr:unnamed protein product [Paramecium primaurelia]CAD8117408.1 unnamed protein product [Paramecium primaurelia]